MSKYWCKCGRTVSKSTKAATTGNRDTENCTGCPYLLPYGPNVWGDAKKAFVRDVQGYECRMTDHPVVYGTHISSLGGPNDKTVLHLESLDFDFLDDVCAWVKETFPDGELSGGFNRAQLRTADYMDGVRVAFTPSQNKKGVAAKQQLFHRFFHPDGTRIDMTPEEEKAKVLADIEKGKSAAQGREKVTMIYKEQEEKIIPCTQEQIDSILLNITLGCAFAEAFHKVCREAKDRKAFDVAMLDSEMCNLMFNRDNLYIDKDNTLHCDHDVAGVHFYAGERMSYLPFPAVLDNLWGQAQKYKAFIGEVVTDPVEEDLSNDENGRMWRSSDGNLYKVGIWEDGNSGTWYGILVSNDNGQSWRHYKGSPVHGPDVDKPQALLQLSLARIANEKGWFPMKTQDAAATQQNAECATKSQHITENPTSADAVLNDNQDGTSLYALDLSERTIHCLERAGIDTVEELADMSDDQIMRIRDMGRKGYDEITTKLDDWVNKDTPDGDTGEQGITTFKELGLSEPCIKLLTKDYAFDDDDLEGLHGLLPEEQEHLQTAYSEDWKKIHTYLQSDGTDTNDGTTEESSEDENPILADDLHWSAAATAAADELAESPEAADLTPTTETAAAVSEKAANVPETVPALDGMPTFDYSGLDEQTVLDLHLAEHEYTHGKKMAEVGFRRMVEGVAIAHDALCGPVVHQVDNSKHGNRGEDSFRAWCASIGIGKTTAYKMLQVADAFMTSSPNQQKMLEQLPSTLLYDFAKPSTTEEVKKDILSGDITTHKQYQEAMARNKQLETQNSSLLHSYETERGRAQAERERADTAERERDTAIQDARCARKEQEESERLADDEIARVQGIADDANDRANIAEAKVKELESRPIEVSGADTADIARWREEGAEQVRQEIATQMAEMQEQMDGVKNAKKNTMDVLYTMAQNVAESCMAQIENWHKAAVCLDYDGYNDCIELFIPLRAALLRLMADNVREDVDKEEMQEC